MKRKKQTKKHEKQPVSLASMQLSFNVFFGIIVSLSLLIAGLLYGACLRVSTLQIAWPTVPDRQMMLEHNVRKVVDGYPIETMAPYIAERKKVTAAFLIGIAKKESNWGKRVPVDETGADCFNYWGYKGAGSRGVEMGHGCFGSPEEAIGIVGGRLDTLIREYKFRTPAEMVVWKCGWSCDGHSSQSVKKWISDVGFYFDKVNN